MMFKSKFIDSTTTLDLVKQRLTSFHCRIVEKGSKVEVYANSEADHHKLKGALHGLNVSDEGDHLVVSGK